MCVALASNLDIGVSTWDKHLYLHDMYVFTVPKTTWRSVLD